MLTKKVTTQLCSPEVTHLTIAEERLTKEKAVVMMNHHGPLTEETVHDLSALVCAGPANRQAPARMQTRMPGGATEEGAGGLACSRPSYYRLPLGLLWFRSARGRTNSASCWRWDRNYRDLLRGVIAKGVVMAAAGSLRARGIGS